MSDVFQKNKHSLIIILFIYVEWFKLNHQAFGTIDHHVHCWYRSAIKTFVFRKTAQMFQSAIWSTVKMFAKKLNRYSNTNKNFEISIYFLSWAINNVAKYFENEIYEFLDNKKHRKNWQRTIKKIVELTSIVNNIFFSCFFCSKCLLDFWACFRQIWTWYFSCTRFVFNFFFHFGHILLSVLLNYLIKWFIKRANKHRFRSASHSKCCLQQKNACLFNRKQKIIVMNSKMNGSPKPKAMLIG